LTAARIDFCDLPTAEVDRVVVLLAALPELRELHLQWSDQMDAELAPLQRARALHCLRIQSEDEFDNE